MINRTAVGAADGVDLHAQVAHAQLLQQVIGGKDQLRVHGGFLRAEALHTELVVFPQAAGLRILIAENRRIQIVQLTGQRLRVQVVLHEAAHGAGRAFRLQSHRAFALVLKGVHFLLHHIGRVADAAQEKLRMLKNRGARFPVARQRGGLAHPVLNILPAIAVGGQYVPRPLGCLS